VDGATVLIALGSNLGDRAGFLLAGLTKLAALEGFELEGLSQIYQTEPVGPAGQGPYLNAVLRGQTTLAPRELLQEMLRIEESLGRVRQQRWGPRTLDLDLLDYDGLVLEEPGLTLPHPRLHQRPFVLVPLGDVAPNWLHPTLGKTAAELLADLDSAGVTLWQPAY